MKPEDRAQELELAEYVSNQAKAIMPVATQPSAKKCECGALIPAARRKAVPGVQTCVECQEFSEKHSHSTKASKQR